MFMDSFTIKKNHGKAFQVYCMLQKMRIEDRPNNLKTVK